MRVNEGKTNLSPNLSDDNDSKVGGADGTELKDMKW